MKPKLYPPAGKLIDIGTHRLHLYSSGDGSPTVILESGGLGWSLDWHLVQTEVAKFTSVCSYDRAGFGWSDPGPGPRTSEQIVKELHTLLENAEISKPFILVGASFGGHTARLFAKTYPDEVAGIVLVDARHEAIDTKMPPAWKKLEATGKSVQQVMLLASRLEMLNLLARLGGEKGTPPILGKLPTEMRPLYLAVGFRPKYFQANLDELAAIAESDRQLSATGLLGNLPVTVIRHGIPEMFAGMPVDQAQQAEQVWQELQAELAKLSSNSRILVAEKVDTESQSINQKLRLKPSAKWWMASNKKGTGNVKNEAFFWLFWKALERNRHDSVGANSHPNRVRYKPAYCHSQDAQ